MPVFVAQSFAFAVFATLICQINSVFPCKDTKAQEFGLCRILGLFAGFFMEGSCIGFWKSKANSTFCKVVKQKGEACFCVWKLLFYQQPCAKAQEFCKAEFLDSTSVLALECFFVYGTGVLISEFSAS